MFASMFATTCMKVTTEPSTSPQQPNDSPPMEGVHLTAEDVLQHSHNPSTLAGYLDRRFGINHTADISNTVKPHLESLELPSGFNEGWTPHDHYFSRFDNLAMVNFSNTSIEIIPSVFMYGCEAIITIILPDTVREVHERAFEGCAKLSEINLPGTVREVHSSAFKGCPKLSCLIFSPELKTTLDYFGERVFEGCDSLPTQVKEGWLQTFNGHLTEADLSTFGSVIPIGKFAGRHDITRVDIPASVSQIGDSAFCGCKNLVIVTFSPTFSGGIGHFAFNGCSAIKSIDLPGSVRAIGGRAFLGCLKLKTVTFPPELKETIRLFGNDVFEGREYESPLSAYIKEGWEPTGELVAEDLAQYGSVINEDYSQDLNPTDVKTMHFPDTVTDIRFGAFSGMHVERVVLPRRLRYLPDYAFYCCLELKEVVLNPNLEGIGSRAFNFCESLERVIYPPGMMTSLLHVGRGVFDGCTALPAGFKELTSTGIYTAKDLEHFGSVIPWIANQGFSRRQDVKEVTIPACVTIIEDSFAGNANLVSLTLPPYLKFIGARLLQNCTSLKKLIVPASVREIHENAFEGCINLETLIVFRSSNPDDLVISNDAFYNCAIREANGPTTIEAMRRNEYVRADERIQSFPNLKTLSAPDSVVAAFAAPHINGSLNGDVELDSAYTGYSTLADLPAAMTCKAFRIQLDTYFWSYKLHANTYTLSQPQRVWVKSFLTCGSRARLHWRPQRNGPRSEECKPNLGHPPLPCIPNDVLLWILPFIKLCELGPAPPYQPATF